MKIAGLVIGILLMILVNRGSAMDTAMSNVVRLPIIDIATLADQNDPKTERASGAQRLMGSFEIFLRKTFRKEVVSGCSEDLGKPCNVPANDEDLHKWLSESHDHVTYGSEIYAQDFERFQLDFGDGFAERTNMDPNDPIWVWVFDVDDDKKFRPLIAETDRDLGILNDTFRRVGRDEVSTSIYGPRFIKALRPRMNKDGDPRISEQEWVNYFVKNRHKQSSKNQ